MLRAAADTNVLISGLITPRGNPGKILDAARKRKFVLIVSDCLLRELKEVAARSRLRAKYPQLSSELRSLLPFLESCSIGDPPRLSRPIIHDDPDDDRVLEVAFFGRADVIISGNMHLLNLNRVWGVQIVRPAEFVQHFLN